MAVWAALCGGVAGVWPRRRDRAPWAGGERGGERVLPARGCASCPSVSPDGPTGPPLLRGAASHEAEGRRGARRGGAAVRVRVGPPATRRRLCVLCHRGDQLVAGPEQFLFVDDVVAVEDGAALVAGQAHGDPLGHANHYRILLGPRNAALRSLLSRSGAKSNSVDRGMVADIAFHGGQGENPHAHIMLTTRPLTPEGFGPKNRNWNKKEHLVTWREDWADAAHQARAAHVVDAARRAVTDNRAAVEAWDALATHAATQASDCRRGAALADRTRHRWAR